MYKKREVPFRFSLRKCDCVFLILNIAYFLWNWTLIPYVPNPLIGGVPLQALLYFLSAPIASIMWGIYMYKFWLGRLWSD
jgi:hypothetical protein